VVVLPDDTFPSLKHKKYVLDVTEGYIRAHNSIYSTTGPIKYMTIFEVLSMDTSSCCKCSGHRPSCEVASLNWRPETLHFTNAPTRGNSGLVTLHHGLPRPCSLVGRHQCGITATLCTPVLER
jgi:hypothetical protein